jgi:hypothetical protein
MYDSTEQKDANLIGDFYLDLDTDLHGDDPESAFNLIRDDALNVVAYMRFVFGIPEEYINIYFSGNKGLHITVPYTVFGVGPHKNLNSIYREMAQEIRSKTKHQTIDLKIYDKVRLFRMVNSKHQKSGLYKVRLTLEEVRTYTLDDIRLLARMPREDSRIEVKSVTKACGQFKSYEKKLDTKIVKRAAKELNLKPLDFTPPCIDYILNNRVIEGQRNSTVAVLASFFHQQSMTQDEARDRLEDWNYKQCTPPMDDEEVEITLNSVYNGGYSYGCSSAKILSVCDSNHCPIGKGKEKRK